MEKEEKGEEVGMRGWGERTRGWDEMERGRGGEDGMR